MRRPQLSYANVMSTIAVFVALGGTSYAVARNSIGTAQLKRNAVTSAKVKDRSLKASDLSAGTRLGLRGPRGPQGPTGPAGAVAATSLQPEEWIALPRIGGWANYGGPYALSGYRKDKQGQVHLHGLVAQANGDVLPSQSPIIAVLPPGYRPAQREILATYGGNPDGASRIDILPDGALTWVVGPNSIPDYLTLTNLSYWPD
jgi:hypothetical protein